MTKIIDLDIELLCLVWCANIGDCYGIASQECDVCLDFQKPAVGPANPMVLEV